MKSANVVGSRINNQLQNDTISITIFMHNVQSSKALPIFYTVAGLNILFHRFISSFGCVCVCK